MMTLTELLYMQLDLKHFRCLLFTSHKIQIQKSLQWLGLKEKPQLHKHMTSSLTLPFCFLQSCITGWNPLNVTRHYRVHADRIIFVLRLSEWIASWRRWKLLVGCSVAFDHEMFFIADSSVFIFSWWLLCSTALIQTDWGVWITTLHSSQNTAQSLEMASISQTLFQ